MKRYDPAEAARSAVSAAADRPAVSVLHDADEGRPVVFRIAPGQKVAQHTSTSHVFLPHAMRADGEELVLAAFITPRPGSR